MKSSLNAADELKSKPHSGSPGEVFRVFLKLGLTSFGGPIAHLGYFRDELVMRRKWLGEADFADLVALCQFLCKSRSNNPSQKRLICSAAPD